MLDNQVLTVETPTQTIACIVDDLHKVKKTNVHKIIEKTCNVRYVGFNTLTDFLQYVNKNIAPDVVLIDIKKLQPNNNVDMYDVVNCISSIFKCDYNASPKIGVIVNIDSDIKLINEIVKSNIKIIAPGIGFSTDEIVEFVNDVKEKEKHVPKKIASRISEDKSKTKKKIAKSDEITLTPRQEQILNLICSKGCSNKMIGKILDLSESTVKLHVGAVLKKYGLRNRTQLALLMIDKKDKM